MLVFSITDHNSYRTIQPLYQHVRRIHPSGNIPVILVSVCLPSKVQVLQNIGGGCEQVVFKVGRGLAGCWLVSWLDSRMDPNKTPGLFGFSRTRAVWSAGLNEPWCVFSYSRLRLSRYKSTSKLWSDHLKDETVHLPLPRLLLILDAFWCNMYFIQTPT